MNIKPTYAKSFWTTFLGNSPDWYKFLIILFLLINPIALFTFGPFITGWLLLLEFILTLAMALSCYPLQPGGLLAIQALVLGMTSAENLKAEVLINFPVILLLMFMVAGIYFMRDLLLFIFTKILITIRSKILLSLMFTFITALLSAFLDALTIIAVIISIGVGFYVTYHRVVSNKTSTDQEHYDYANDDNIADKQELLQFRSFLRGLLMHSAVGTALGGVFTPVGEPQNLLIANYANWNFAEFVIAMLPVTLPVLVVGLMTCILLEYLRFSDYGTRLPDKVFKILKNYDQESTKNITPKDINRLVIQAISAILLIIALALHLAEVGFIGLMIIILQTAFNGVTEEHKLGQAFSEALPFTALLVVFFCIVSVIHEQHLFKPTIEFVFSLQPEFQLPAMYMANGILSAISDNVFVATVYASEIKAEFDNNHISREFFENLMVAVNTGTNLPSVATPNGQAAFLFLLTSSIAPLIGLSYGRMILLALPYTITLTITGLVCINLFY